MPLTDFQRNLAKVLAPNRTSDSHLAGGAALHRMPTSKRYSNDLDYFHDSVERVAQAFTKDEQTLFQTGYKVSMQINQPGFIRAIVSLGDDATKVEWSHDSSWRFMPVVADAEVGYQLDPVDLAINKLLALAGRDEPRDFLDILFAHKNILSIGALCWAAVGKDPGFTPRSLLELIRRRGKYRTEDFARLNLTEPVDVVELKSIWLAALDDAEQLIARLPPEELGCLYFSVKQNRFVVPEAKPLKNSKDVVAHYGRPGGMLPRIERSAK